MVVDESMVNGCFETFSMTKINSRPSLMSYIAHLLSLLLDEYLRRASEAIGIKGRGTWEKLFLDRDLVREWGNKPATTDLGYCLQYAQIKLMIN